MPRKRITLPRVSPYAPDSLQAFAGRIDSIVQELEIFLRDFQAERATNADHADLSTDTENVDGTPAEEAIQTGRNLFYYTFENDIDDYWNAINAPGTIAYTSNGKTGGRALEATGQRWDAYPENIPFDPTRLYRIRARARMTTAPSDPAKDKVYVGVEGVAADGTTLVNTSGSDTHSSQHYNCVSNEDMGNHTLGEWQEFVGYFQGTAATGNGGASSDPSNPKTLHDDVRYIRPLFILNYSGGDGVMEIDYISIEVLTESPEVNLGNASGQVDSIRIADNAVVTSKLLDGAVATAKIEDGSVLTAKIDDAAVVTSKLDDGAVTTLKIGDLQVTSGKINDGSISVAKHASGLRPVEIVSSLPAAGNQGRTVFLTTDNKLYRDDGTSWTAAVPTSDLTGEVGTSLLSNDAVTQAKLAAGAVGDPEIIDGAVIEAKLGSGAVTTVKLDSGSVTEAKIGSSAVTSAKIGSAAVTEAKIGDLAVTRAKVGQDLSVYLSSGKEDAVINGDFEDGGAFWIVPAGGTYTIDSSADAYKGSSLKIVTDGGSRSVKQGETATEFSTNNSDAHFLKTRVEPGDRLRVKAASKVESTNNAIFRLREYDADQTRLRNSDVLTWTETSWTEKETTYTVPSDTYYVAIELVNSNSSTLAAWFDEIHLWRMKSTEDLVDAAVTEAIIDAAAVTETKVASDAISTPKLQAGAVTAAKITAGTITSTEIATDTILAGNIAAGAVTAAEIAAGTITASEIATGTITATEISGNTITASEISGNTITAAEISAGAITATEIATDAVEADKILAGAVVATKIATDAVVAAKIAAGAVTTVKLDAAAVEADKIASNAVTTAKLNADAVTVEKIALFGGTLVDELYVRGTGMNNNGTRVVRVGGSTLINASGRGVALTVLKRSDHSELTYYRDGTNTSTLAKSQVYDLYATDADRVDLTNALIELRANGNATRSAGEWGDDIIVILTSNDASRFHTGSGPSLVDEMLLHGATEGFREVGPSPDHRTPYLLIGVPGIQEGRGIEIITSEGSDDPPAEYNGLLVDGTPAGFGGLSEQSIGATIIQDGSIVTDKLDAQAVTAAKIKTGTITATQIDSNTITATELAADSVEATQINVATLDAISVDAGVLTAGRVEDAGATPTRGILISGSVPGDWTQYLNLIDGTQPFLNHDALTLSQDGSADFSGVVSADTFSGDKALFDGFVEVERVSGVGGEGMLKLTGLTNYGKIAAGTVSSGFVEGGSLLLAKDSSNPSLFGSTGGLEITGTGGLSVTDHIVIGTDPGGSDLLRVGGFATFGSSFVGTAETDEGIINLLVGSAAPSGHDRNGLVFYENNTSPPFRMSIQYDGSGSGGDNLIGIYKNDGTRTVAFKNSGDLVVGAPTSGAVVNVVHHGTGSASSVGVEGTLHTEDA